MPKKSLPNNTMDDNADDFEGLYAVHQPLIYRFMFWRTQDEMLAQDLTSNVFEKAWRTRANFKGGSTKAWLYKIASNTLIDHWRKKKDVLVDDNTLEAVLDDGAALGDQVDMDLAVANLQKALNKLPKEMRQVVELRFIERLSARQTADRLDLSEANVRVIQFRALKKLRGYLQ